MSSFYRSKGYKKKCENNKHKLNAFIEKKLKKFFKEKNKRKQELRAIEKMDVSKSEESVQSHDDSITSSKKIIAEV